MGDGVNDQRGNVKHDACFTFKPLAHQLSEAGIDWAYYAADWGQSGYFWNAYNGIYDEAYWHAHLHSVDRLIEDIRANKLPDSYPEGYPGWPPGARSRPTTSNSDPAKSSRRHWVARTRVDLSFRRPREPRPVPLSPGVGAASAAVRSSPR